MLKNLQLIFGAIIARDLWCFLTAKLYCWRKRRQTQRQAEAERLQRRREADEKAAQREQVLRSRSTITRTFAEQIRAYPFVIEVETDHNCTLAMREIVCMLRAEDKRRFFTVDRSAGVN